MHSIVILIKEAMKIIKPTTISTSGTFTRSTVGYYTNVNGVITQAAINTPRFNYKAANLTAGATLLLEAAATNYIEYSSQFDNAFWFKQAVTITPDLVVSPDGTTTGDRLNASAGSGFHALSALTNDYSGPLSLSVYAKKGTANWVKIGFTDISTAINYTAYFDLNTGTIGTISGGATCTIEDCLNGWYRCSVSATVITAHFPYIEPHTADAQAANWTAAGTENVYIWQAQYERTINFTSPIYTSGGPGTRAADSNTSMMLSNIPENDYPVWSAATTYGVGDLVLDLTTHKIFSSSVAGNLNHPPPNISYWVDTGYDNRWRMFDQSVNSQTSSATGITVGVLPAARFDSIIGLNISAATVNVNVNDPVSGIVYEKTLPMTSYSDIQDWYAYFYTPIQRLTDFVIGDIPPVYSNATINVTLSSTGTSSIGALLVGLSKTLGISEWGTKVGIIDYSVKTVDAFGNYTIVQRNFSKRVDFSVQVPTNSVDDVHSTLASYRSTPVIYIGSNDNATQQFTSTIVYGFYKDFSIDIAYPAYSVCTAQIEGLT
jgi:hypothetical protein